MNFNYMDDQQVIQPNIQPTTTYSYWSKKRIITVTAIVVGVIAIAVAGYFLLKKYQAVNRTPEETLEDLKASSAPDNSVAADKSATVKLLNDYSSGSVKTEQERINILNSLSN